jgi:hypothetical protein
VAPVRAPRAAITPADSKRLEYLQLGTIDGCLDGALRHLPVRGHGRERLDRWSREKWRATFSIDRAGTGAAVAQPGRRTVLVDPPRQRVALWPTGAIRTGCTTLAGLVGSEADVALLKHTGEVEGQCRAQRDF